MTELSEDDRQELCRIARTTLREYAYASTLPPGLPHRPLLLNSGSAAVHVWQGDRLRGRGVLLDEGNQLYYAVELAAVQAGFFDPRSERLQPEEIAELRIVVTVLGPAEVVRQGHDELEPDRHAVVVRTGPLQGVFTPECVRGERWNRAAWLAAIHRSVGGPGLSEKLIWQRYDTQRFSNPPIAACR